MHVKLKGKVYKVKSSNLLSKGLNGFCETPYIKRPQIAIHKGLRGKTRLLVYLHEFLHALEWGWNETRVENRSKDLAEALWKVGFRLSTKKCTRSRGRRKARTRTRRKVSAK